MSYYMVDQLVPDVTLYMHEVDPELAGGCAIDNTDAFTWKIQKVSEVLAGKKVVIFGLPGAFTPTCTNNQLPGYDARFNDFKALGVDEIYCTSVNDAFVMDKWGVELGVQNVKMLPDGNGEFADSIGMLVKKANLGFGYRSWRYAMLVDNLKIVGVWSEPGQMYNCPTDPYGVSAPDNVYNEVKEILGE
jgi:peroxiredoxin